MNSEVIMTDVNGFLIYLFKSKLEGNNIMSRQMHLGALLFSSGHHGAAWRRSGSTVSQVGQIDYFEKLAQLAEGGKFDTIFFADGQSIMGGYYGGVSYFLEPITCVTAMARKTHHIGLVPTISSTLYDPYNMARLICSLDHISHGRAGVNVITSMFDEEAQNHGLSKLPDGGGHATVVGSPEEVADMMQNWFESGAADGFNIMAPTYPESLADFIHYVVPILQKRGLFRKDYTGHTLRDNLGLPVPTAKITRGD
jgi:alkanesulfonate monooxygenase SsuD/methylene tetrahydromethanopterin reductase-like flavin-dependent oxidoreductase (luciferase family)